MFTVIPKLHYILFLKELSYKQYFHNYENLNRGVNFFLIFQMIFKDPKLKKYAIDLLFDLKNNTTIKGLYHKIDGCSLSTVDFFVHFE